MLNFALPSGVPCGLQSLGKDCCNYQPLCLKDRVCKSHEKDGYFIR